MATESDTEDKWTAFRQKGNRLLSDLTDTGYQLEYFYEVGYVILLNGERISQGYHDADDAKRVVAVRRRIG